jgi:RNA polymerase sigma factor (sigma-70 family)
MANASLGPVVHHLRGLAAQPGPRRSDHELLQDFLTRNDQPAFAALVRRHGALVFAVCRRELQAPEDAEDAFQATFLLLAQKAGSIRKQEALASWLHGVAYRMAQNAKRAAARRRKHEVKVGPRQPSAPPPDEAWREMQAILDEEVQRLPAAYREPFVLCFLQGLSRAEVAAQLALTGKALEGRLARARSRLRTQLARRGVSLTAVLAAASLAPGARAAPGALVSATLDAATVLAAGGAVPARVAALMKGTMKTMFATKFQIATAVLLTAIAGAGLLAQRAPEAKKERPEAPAPMAKKAGEKGQQARADRYGDPLPPGALVRLGTVRLRHEATIWAGQVVFSPDGKTLLSGGDDTKVRIWDVASGKQIGVLQGPPSKDLARGITALAVSADGKLLASADNNKTLRLWDLKKRRLLRSMVGTNARCLAFTPDGKTLISGGDGYDRSIRLWDVTTGKERRRFLWHKREVSSILYVPDGQALISTDRSEGKIYTTDLATGAVLRALECSKIPKGAWGGAPDALAIAPGARVLAWGETLQWENPQRWTYRLRLIDLATGKDLRQLLGHEKGTIALAFSPDGKVLASASWDRTIRLWNVGTGKELCKITRTHSDTRRLVFAPDGKTLASIGGDSTIHLWEVATGKELQRREGHLGGVGSVAFSPDGRIVASCSFGDQPPLVRLWDAATGKPLRALSGHKSYMRSVAFLPDGKGLVSSSCDGTLRAWDMRTGKETRQLRLPDMDQVYSMGLSADGKVLVVQSHGTAPEDKFTGLWITVWDLRAGKLLSQRRGDPFGGGLLSYSPDGRSIAQQARHGVVVRESATGKELRLLKVSDAAQHGYAFSPDGKLLAVPSRKGKIEGSRAWYEDCAVRIYELATARERLVVPTGDYCRGLGFSPNGKLLAWASHDVVAVYDAVTGKEVLRRAVTDGNVLTLAFSPDGRKLATGLNNATVLIWDVTQKDNRDKRSPRRN